MGRLYGREEWSPGRILAQIAAMQVLRYCPRWLPFPVPQHDLTLADRFWNVSWLRQCLFYASFAGWLWLCKLILGSHVAGGTVATMFHADAVDFTSASGWAATLCTCAAAACGCVFLSRMPVGVGVRVQLTGLCNPGLWHWLWWWNEPRSAWTSPSQCSSSISSPCAPSRYTRELVVLPSPM